MTLVKGDITTVEVDAVVNAANSHLVVGGGVCAAIHAKGGPTIADECRIWTEAKGPVPPGEAAITSAGDLPARYVIHVVGPMWHGGSVGEPEQLRSSYEAALRLADDEGLTSIAFPSVATGIFGYPTDLAAPLALATVRDTLREMRSVTDVTFVLFDDATYEAYRSAFDALYD
jgi:O-acetyl-ADP-ribose deacetylase (regulator of RNase III)